MADLLLSRRAFLIGCSAAASPLLTPISFAAAPGENRLVVIVLRGAMDGLDLLRPLDDPAYRALRPKLAADAAASVDLGGRFALHPAAAGLVPLWEKGELGFAHAVATPYRDRSHFVGQDVLENGAGAGDGGLTPRQDGWLNRAVAQIPGATAETAVSVGLERMLILDGATPTGHFLPVHEAGLSSQGQVLLSALHGEDPQFAPVFAGAQQLVEETAGMKRAKGVDGGAELGGYVAGRLRDEARIASFSLGGWDTHQGQERHFPARLDTLVQAILAIRDGLGPLWDKTMLLAMTEFGRTAAENGTGGTDHGTGGALVMAGGALRGGKVHGRWPGLAEADLLDRRDLRPTGDVRAYAGWALHDLFGLGLSEIEGAVFPDLEMGASPQLLL